jgi:CRISPR-associated protein Csd1
VPGDRRNARPARSTTHKEHRQGREPTPKLVSFDKDTDAFDSFGKKQGNNAPVSEKAAFGYTTALNDLLRKEKRQRTQIGDATAVYWAEATDQRQAEAAEKVVGWLFEPPSLEQRDAAEVQVISEVMALVAKGRPLDSPELHLKPGTRFYILGLSPNAARLSIRFWSPPRSELSGRPSTTTGGTCA